MTKLVVGNWKMNGLAAALGEIEAVRSGAADMAGVGVCICPPATLIAQAAAAAKGSPILIGAQDCHARVSGAHTGDISAEMLADAGAKMIIVGHSERRNDHGEGDPIVRAKAEAVLRAGLTAILCVGESRTERDQGHTFTVLGRQLAGSVPDDAVGETLVIAYEPVWAIGTGLTPTGDDIAAAHAHIRSVLVDRFGDEARAIRVLYGGSVKPDNAGEIAAIEGVDGALVGGASLKASDFLPIVRAYGA